MSREEYLQILFDDFGYTRAMRNALLSHETGRQVRYLDQLTAQEQSRFIDFFKEIKELHKAATIAEDLA